MSIRQSMLSPLSKLFSRSNSGFSAPRTPKSPRTPRAGAAPRSPGLAELQRAAEDEWATKMAAKKQAREAKQESRRKQQAEHKEQELRYSQARKSITQTKQALKLKQSKIKVLRQGVARASAEYESTHKAVLSSTKSRDKLEKELKRQTLLLAKLIKDRERCAKSKAKVESQMVQEEEAHRQAQAEVNAASKRLRELAPKGECKPEGRVQGPEGRRKTKRKVQKKDKVLKKPAGM